MRMPFIVILLMVVAAQVYVMWRLCLLLPVAWWVKVVAGVVMMAAFAASFVAVLPALDRMPMTLSSVVYHVGTSWIIILMYLVMIFVVVDLLRLCHILPDYWLVHNGVAAAGLGALMLAVFTYGYIHYINKERVALSLTTDKPLSRPLRIVMTSDWHLGYHNRRAELARWVDSINAEHPDIILVAGDLIDRSLRPLNEERMAEELRRLQAPVYACLGNHEYYSGYPQALQFYHDAGIHLLQDSMAVVGDIVIIGRDDRSHQRRKSLSQLMADVPVGKYTLVMDHQPYHLERVEAAGVDFQLSGHTHHGQVWPISWVTERMYECAYGSYRRGNTRYYVSSGLGIWGGKFRIGTQSEYVVATLE